MIDFSNNAASYLKPLPLEKLFDVEIINRFDISEVIWSLSIKPQVRNVTKYIDGRIRLEEIEVFEVKVNKITTSK